MAQNRLIRMAHCRRLARRPYTSAGVLAAALSLPLPGFADSSLRFFGGFSSNDVDRVKIRIDDPADDEPGPPADIGSGDFTIDVWIKATADNTQDDRSCGVGAWVEGNVIIDRDRYGVGRAYGLSLLDGMPVFQVENASLSGILCGTNDLRDGQWHHLAMQRRGSDGRLWLYVDGVLEDERGGPVGDISYPDDAVCADPDFCAQSDHFLVFGAEKHDVGYGFDGWIDEVRLSTVLRYPAQPFPTEPFGVDAETAALYHFDEGVGAVLSDAAAGGQSAGVLRLGVGGGTQAGPVWSGDTPLCAGGYPTRTQFDMGQYGVDEDAGSVTISVTRACDTAGAVSVDYITTDMDAAESNDYAAVSGTLNWDAGDGNAKLIVIEVTDDRLEESNESFAVTLSNPGGASTLGTPAMAEVLIVDNDGVHGDDEDGVTDTDSGTNSNGD
ncbi:MAG: LamG domain-containing protein, partial [Gammaproteobacteria bacterium]|nr:LamG domain-containing protein [Gammaproteobacteria bacterium]